MPHLFRHLLNEFASPLPSPFPPSQIHKNEAVKNKRGDIINIGRFNKIVVDAGSVVGAEFRKQVVAHAGLGVTTVSGMRNDEPYDFSSIFNKVGKGSMEEPVKFPLGLKLEFNSHVSLYVTLKAFEDLSTC